MISKKCLGVMFFEILCKVPLMLRVLEALAAPSFLFLAS